MTTIFGKIDCLSSASLTTSTTIDSYRLTTEIYTGTFKFLQYLQTQGVTTLVSYFAGSGSNGVNPGGAGAGTEYWDFVANSTGAIRMTNSWSVWRFNPWEDRNWSWYLYLHCNAGAGISLPCPWNVPTFYTNPTKILWDSNAGTSSAGYNYGTGIGMQAAVSISGANSINPWNGTIDLTGLGTKGNGTSPWTTASAGYSLHVLPRINAMTGAAVTEKDTIVPFYYADTLGPKNSMVGRYHLVSDGHSLFFICQIAWNGVAFPNTYPIGTFVGAHKLMDTVVRTNTASLALLGGTSSYALAMFTTMYPWNTPSTTQNTSGIVTTMLPYYTNIDFPTSTPSISQGAGWVTSNPLGGLLVTSKHGVRRFQLANNYGTPAFNNGFTNSLTGLLEELPIYVLMTEGPVYSGTIGYLNPLLVRSINGVNNHDTNSLGTRAIFGASATTTVQKISIPWSGSNPPGTNTTRDGITFRIDNYNY